MRKSVIVTAIFIVMTGIASGLASSGPSEGNDVPSALDLSPETTELLRGEMQAITEGVQDVTLALSIGDWQTIIETSERIRASYILDQELTDAQKKELMGKLPDAFIKLDEEFHARAGKLRVAAENRDVELAAFHLYRMIESCATCHAAYAPSRFPGFSRDEPEEEGHHHH